MSVSYLEKAGIVIGIVEIDAVSRHVQADVVYFVEGGVGSHFVQAVIRLHLTEGDIDIVELTLYCGLCKLTLQSA